MLSRYLLSDRLSLRRLSLGVKIALTIAIVLVVALFRLVVAPYVTGMRFLLFFPTVAVVAILFDSGMGYLAGGLSAVISASVFVPSRYGWPQGPTEWALVVLSLGFMLFESWLVETLTRALRVLRQAERDKTALLAELNHRTKNNLQMLCSILTVQALSIADPATRRLFEDTITRIGVIGRIHGTLYSTGRYETIDVRDFLRDLCTALQESLVAGQAVTIRVEAEPWRVDTDRAIPLGLVVNELVTNALKHAFPGNRTGTVTVRVTRDNGTVRLVVEDNGVGMAWSHPVGTGASSALAEAGVGSKLAEILSRQLGGTLRTTSDSGTRAELVFPLPAG